MTVTSMGESGEVDRGRALAALRGILVLSLSRENLPQHLADCSPPSLVPPPPVPPSRRRRRVRFVEEDDADENAGAAPVDPNQKQSSSRPSSAKQGGLHWFAHGAEAPALTNQVSGFDSEGSSDRYGRDTWSDGTSLLDEGKENAAVTQRDREERLRQLKERQNEERQRKLEELKQQAVAAQKFREQKEEERRRRMEELRVRDNDRRHQVEERKRQIWEAERDRREAILRKNQEREARIESKRKNERSSIMFAFGSSTPRMLEPADTGGSYWATRSLVTGYDEGALKIDRKTATSTSNVMMLSMTAPPGPLTRRSSERELDGSKKRATSAGGINRNKEGLRSGEVTPSRPQSSLSQHSVSSSSGMTTSMTSSNVRSRPVATPRRPRPYSIAVTGISSAPDTPRQSLSSEHRAGKSGASANEKPPLPKVHTTKKQPAPAKPELAKKPTSEKIKSTKSSAATTPKATPLQSPGVDAPPLPSGGDTLVDITTTTTSTTATMVSNGGDSDAVVTVSETTTVITEQPLSPSADVSESKPQPTAAAPKVETPAAPAVQPPQPQNVQQDTLNELPESDMTASMIARKITTEEEAKAALAERRRLAREQAEREAELQRLRLEAERLAEEERLRQEEEEQRRAEEEQLRLLEEARAAEEVRLQEAIKETQKREEEERARKEEEEKLKKEKEEAERKAKEEAEKQRQEMEIRLKKEEEDRQARRKRVEAIMLRTRGKGTTPTSTPTKDGDELYDSSVEGVSNNGVEQFLNAERSQATSVETPNDAAATPKHNGHRNGVAVVDDNQALEKNNITNNLLDLSSLDTSQPAGEILQPTSGDTTTTTTNGKLANEDSVNFNNQSYIAFQDSNTVNDLLS
ncbi:ensconsin isoform X48 [Nilaparvata lugens]|uniref:ensconsin isoform X48 n=1 Tax=Nilaparvata lugens TaxID=108931 RepID=UPI00193E435D|nr:ensconsin isoform X48 [Nilaparvata lugens]